ncbi:hypothetical protein [Hyalangium versicolor]|uniref:hypothetical protein n=1 Tax=Hyalangium versicolor TaxID=2861190 RepID=UPI001CCA9473|nr:hypothetical protein [Hyalangium versicolor]
MSNVDIPRLDKARLRALFLKELEAALVAAESKVAQAQQTAADWSPQNRAALLEIETTLLEKTKRTCNALESLPLGPSGDDGRLREGTVLVLKDLRSGEVMFELVLEPPLKQVEGELAGFKVSLGQPHPWSMYEPLEPGKRLTFYGAHDWVAGEYEVLDLY